MNTQVKVTEKEQAWGKCEMGAGAYTYLCTHTYELEEILYRITIFLFYSNIAK